MSRRILVIEDEIDTLAMYTFILEWEDYEVTGAVTATEGLQKASQFRPNLILLDIMLPDLDGWQTCQRLRKQSKVPIVMISVLDSPRHIEKGFAVGADGYLTKPLGAAELKAYVRAILRRVDRYSTSTSEAQLRYKDIEVNMTTHEVRVGTRKVDLSPLEFKLLVYMLQHKHQTISTTDLVNYLWEFRYSHQNLRQYIFYLRRKIEPDPANPTYIHNVWGTGYRFG